ALLPGDGLARTFAGAGVGARALAADRQAAAVAVATPTADVAQPRDVLLDAPPQSAFHQVRAIDHADDLGQLFFREVFGAALTVDRQLLEDLVSIGRPDA